MAPMTSAAWIWSQRPGSTVAAGYRVADLASDLVAVMEAAGFERFSVFGPVHRRLAT